MKAIVTGATGFVGGWLTNYLVSKGHSVSVLCRSQTDFVPGVNVLVGDVTDEESLSSAFNGHEVVFHLAGVVGYSKAQRELMDRVNVQGTKNVISAVLKNKCDKLVHMSSVVAVGANTKPEPLNEESEYNIGKLNLGYFESKRAAELEVLKSFRDDKLDTVILNPSTIYGPGDVKKGSRSVQLKVANGKFPFYPPGGVNVVDVRAVVQALEAAVEKGRSGQRYILSSENLYIKELFQIIAERSGVKPPHIPLPKPLVRLLGIFGDSMERIGKKGPINSENAWASILFHWFESKKAQKELGFNPMSSKKAIHRSIDWAIEHGYVTKSQ